MPAGRDYGPPDQERRGLLQGTSAFGLCGGAALGALGQLACGVKVLADRRKLLLEVPPDLGEFPFELTDPRHSLAFQPLDRSRVGISETPLPGDPQALPVQVDLAI